MKKKQHIFYVGKFAIDPQTRTVTFGDDIIKIQPKVMQLLNYLAQQPNQVIPREELFENLWKNVYVTEDAIHRTISQLRTIFKKDESLENYIETIPKTGYRLVAPVKGLDLNKSTIKPSPKRMLVKAGILFFLITIFIYYQVKVNLMVNETIPVIKNLTSHEGVEATPRFSPDGTKILYSQKEMNDTNGAYLLDLIDKKAPELLIKNNFAADFYWSSDGSEIFSVIREGDKCTINKHLLVGAFIQNITTCLAHQNHYIFADVFNEIMVTNEVDQADLDDGVVTMKTYLINLITKERSLLLDPPKNMSDSEVRISPDGNKILMTRVIKSGANELFVYDLQLKVLKQLTFDDAMIFGVDWVNNEQITYVSNKSDTRGLWVTDIEGSKPVWMNVILDNLNEIDVSPDGQQLVFQTLSNTSNVVQLNLDETIDLSYITQSNKNIYLPQISPDNTKMAYVSNESGNHDLWISNIDGSEVLKLADDGVVFSGANWSPNGQYIAYIASREGNRDVCIVNVSTAEKECLVEGHHTSLPTWSPDGLSIYFSQRSDLQGVAVELKQIEISTKVIRTLPNLSHGLLLQQNNIDDKMAYYVNTKDSNIYQVNTSNWESEPLITDLLKSFYKSWQLTQKGIYYVNNQKELMLFDFSSKEHQMLRSLKGNGYAKTSSLNIIESTNQIIVSLFNEKAEGNIGVIENFSELMPYDVSFYLFFKTR